MSFTRHHDSIGIITGLFVIVSLLILCVGSLFQPKKTAEIPLIHSETIVMTEVCMSGWILVKLDVNKDNEIDNCTFYRANGNGTTITNFAAGQNGCNCAQILE